VPSRWFITFAAAALLSGCAQPEFSLYSGQQQNWPTQPGAFVNAQYAVPIYVRSYPNRPYNVIGYLEATTTRIAVTYAAQRAKKLGADAMTVFEEGYAGSISTGGTFTTGSFYPGGFSANTAGVSSTMALTKAQFIAIKWR
jgi:hypothetical protein